MNVAAMTWPQTHRSCSALPANSLCPQPGLNLVEITVSLSSCSHVICHVHLCSTHWPKHVPRQSCSFWRERYGRWRWHLGICDHLTGRERMIQNNSVTYYSVRWSYYVDYRVNPACAGCPPELSHYHSVRRSSALPIGSIRLMPL